MPARPGPSSAALIACVALAFAGGCGGGSGNDDEARAPEPAPAPSARAQDFPSAKGKTLESLRAGLPKGPTLAPATTASLQVGTARVAFALIDDANKQIAGAPVAVYTTNQDGSGARGPYLARSESLAVKPEFRSRSTSQDPDSARSLYVADVPLRREGRQVFTGVARLDGRLVATTGFEVPVQRPGRKGRPPEVGDPAIRISTPTIASEGGDVAAVTTRVPPAEALVRTNFRDVVGRRPVVLQFSTPLLCQSRVCGPVTDVLAQVQSRFASKAAFIQQEIYRDNEVNKGFRPQVEAWRLPTEPWTFVIDRRGTVVDRFEGPVSIGELERAVAKAV